MPKPEGKKRTGRPPKHGGFSLMVRAGEIPERVSHIRAYLTRVREGLIENAAGREVELTAGQAVLIDRAVSILGVIRTIEETLSEQGIMAAGVLAPVLQDNYLAYCNSLRLILRELGIERRERDELLTPLQVAAEIDRGKAEGKDTGAPGVVDPGASEGEIQGEDHERSEGPAGSGETSSDEPLCGHEGGGGIRDREVGGEAAEGANG